MKKRGYVYLSHCSLSRYGNDSRIMADFPEVIAEYRPISEGTVAVFEPHCIGVLLTLSQTSPGFLVSAVEAN